MGYGPPYDSENDILFGKYNCHVSRIHHDTHGSKYWKNFHDESDIVTRMSKN